MAPPRQTREEALAVLGLTPEIADEETIRKAYKKLALVNHPDKNSARPDAARGGGRGPRAQRCPLS